MMIKRFALLCALAIVTGTVCYGDTQSGSVTATLNAKIVAIDRANRIVTLQDQQGDKQDIQAGPGVKRFDDLKVGDTVTIAYQESVALKIVKPSADATPMPDSSPIVTRYDGAKPGGQVSQTMVATVTIKAIDPSKPSVTVQTGDGKVITMLVEDKHSLDGYKVGDTVEITYSQALMIQVK